MTRRTLLAAAGAAALSPAQPRRPNIVFMLVDDLRWDALGYSGHPFAQTPNIDRLAREGAQFTNAFVTTPLCSPSRASYLTGQYVHTHGVKDNGDNSALSHKLITWPRLLKDAGYRTGYFGKWHMGTDDSPRPGFDRWVSFRGQGIFNNPPMNIDGKQINRRGYMTDILSTEAAAFISSQGDTPFCAYVAHKAVHGPFTPAARHAKDYATTEIRRAPSFADTFAGKKALTRPIPDQAPHGENPGPNDEVIKNQLRCLRSIDDGVGQILDALAKTNQLDNTLVLFTSDNGYFWGEHKLGDKRWAYEESIRIPMVARWPARFRPAARIEEDVLNIDVAPTMLEAAGLAPNRQFQGRSVLPLAAGKKRGWRKSFLSEYFLEQNFPKAPTWQAVRGGGWKYVRYPDLPDSDELYNIAADKYEMRNLIGERSAAGRLKRLKGDLQALLK